MVPLILFLAVWAILILGFALMALITCTMSLRFGISGFMTLSTNTVFVLVTLLVLGGTGFYLIGVNWAQTVSILPNSIPSLEL